MIGERFLSTLTSWVNRAVAGKLSDDTRAWLSAARLLTPVKAQWRGATCCDWRSAEAGGWGRCCASTLKRICQACSSPIRLASACRMEHLRPSLQLRCWWEEGVAGQRSTWVMAKVDLSNAFNRVDRKVLLTECRDLCPDVFPWAAWLYRCSSSLLLGNGQELSSQQGVQQGDPLGPLLFSLALQRLVDRLTPLDRGRSGSWTTGPSSGKRPKWRRPSTSSGAKALP